MCCVANSRRPTHPGRLTPSPQGRHLYVVRDDARAADGSQAGLFDDQELRRLAQLREMAIRTGASKEAIRLIDSASTAEEAMTRLSGAGLLPDEADSFEGMLSWFAPLLEPDCDQLEAEICGCEFVGELRRAAPPDLDVADVLRDVIEELPGHQDPAALAMSRVLAAVGPASVRPMAAAAARRIVSGGQPDMPWAADLGTPKPGACFGYADLYGEQRSIVITYSYGRKKHALAVLIDYVLGGGIKDCYPVDYTSSLRDDYRKIGGQPDLLFTDLEGGEARQILAAALSREPCPADPEQVEDLENFLDLLAARVELLPPPVATRIRPRTTAATPTAPATRAATVARRTAGAKNVHRLKVTLRGSKPPIWRRFEVPSDITLARLHLVIQLGFGWENSHLYLFETPAGRYGDPDPDIDLRSAAAKKLSAVADWPGDKLRYEYDFGDGWEHDIVVEAVQPAEHGIAYPRCTAGKRACPPEDSGGIWGYSELLNILANPRHEGHEQMLQWLGISSPAEFDPAGFDLDAASKYLASIAKTLIRS